MGEQITMFGVSGRVRSRRPRGSNMLREYHRDWYNKNADMLKERAAEYRRRNKEKTRADNAAYRAANPEAIRSNHLKRTYGLTLAEWLEIHRAQGGVCPVVGCGRALCSCSKQPVGTCADCGGIRAATDHDHASSSGNRTEHRKLDYQARRRTIRGLLCSDCNRRLGTLEDEGVAYQAAAFRAYLENPPARAVLA